MNNCINLTTEEVRMILAGGTKLVIPFKPQPHAGVRESVFVPSGMEDGHGIEIKPSYQAGMVIYGREPWTYLSMLYPAPHMKYFYLADGKVLHLRKKEKYRSAAVMPKEAARIFLRIESVEVKRVQDVTIEEAVKMVEEGDHETDPFSGRSFCWFKSYNEDDPLTANPKEALFNYYMMKHGFESYENNDWIWLLSFTKVDSLNP